MSSLLVYLYTKMGHFPANHPALIFHLEIASRGECVLAFLSEINLTSALTILSMMTNHLKQTTGTPGRGQGVRTGLRGAGGGGHLCHGGSVPTHVTCLLPQ